MSMSYEREMAQGATFLATDSTVTNSMRLQMAATTIAVKSSQFCKCKYSTSMELPA
jgi:hypothetical protein